MEACMTLRTRSIVFITAGAWLIIFAGIWLASAQPVEAQCGSSASSCKNCHEVQGELPVNQDGTSWHASHAFGDFCNICHAGNSQATEATEAHSGMEAPLSDIHASCQQCHPNDLQARAQVYADQLGVEIGAGSESGTGEAVQTTAATDESNPEAALVMTQLAIDDPNLVNYTERYNQIVLGQQPVNWGNVILGAMSLMLLVGGGGFVLTNEKLVKISFGDTKTVEGTYPSDVVDMLPAIATLNPSARKTLKSLLTQPAKTTKVLGLIDEVISDSKDEANQ
jgi:hypothetical protein